MPIKTDRIRIRLTLTGCCSFFFKFIYLLLNAARRKSLSPSGSKSSDTGWQNFCDWVTKLMDYSNTVCAATQWVPPETGLQLITTSQRHIRLTDGFSAANYLQVNKCIKIIKATVASLRLVSPGAATDRSHPSTLSTLRVSTTTLGQFQSVVKTVLFRLAYGTWLGSFVTVQALSLIHISEPTRPY